MNGGHSVPPALDRRCRTRPSSGPWGGWCEAFGPRAGTSGLTSAADTGTRCRQHPELERHHQPPLCPSSRSLTGHSTDPSALGNPCLLGTAPRGCHRAPDFQPRSWVTEGQEGRDVRAQRAWAGAASFQLPLRGGTGPVATSPGGVVLGDAGHTDPWRPFHGFTSALLKY